MANYNSLEEMLNTTENMQHLVVSTGHDDDTGTQPAVSADAHRHVVLQSPGPQFRANGVPSRRNGHIRAKHGVIPHINVGIIHQLQAGIDIHILAQMHMMAAPVGKVGRFDIAVLPHFRKQALEHFRPLCLKPPGCAVVFVHQIQIAQLFFHNGGIIGPVDIAAVDLFPFRHIRKPSCHSRRCEPHCHLRR